MAMPWNTKGEKMFKMVEQLTNLNRILMTHGNLISTVIAGWEKVLMDPKVQSKNSCQHWAILTLIYYTRMEFKRVL